MANVRGVVRSASNAFGHGAPWLVPTHRSTEGGDKLGLAVRLGVGHEVVPQHLAERGAHLPADAREQRAPPLLGALARHSGERRRVHGQAGAGALRWPRAVAQLRLPAVVVRA